MDYIIPLAKLVDAINKELYGVIKESFLIGEYIINKGGKVIVQGDRVSTPEVVKVFENMQDFQKWFDELLDSYSQWNIPD